MPTAARSSRRYSAPQVEAVLKPLKPPHSKRCRDHAASSNLAKRLDCGAFTAAFARSAGMVRELTGTPALPGCDPVALLN